MKTIESCKFCGIDFGYVKHLREKFCSRKCYLTFRKSTPIPQWLRKKMSRACMGRKLTPLTKKKISLAITGIRRSDETRLKQSIAAQGRKNHNWKGGKKKDHSGYVLQLCPGHPQVTSSGRVFEHRLVMEKYLGRYLTSKEQIHHINGRRDDNRIENLQLFPNKSDHLKYHWTLEHYREKMAHRPKPYRKSL